MDELRKLVVALAAMSESDLRRCRQTVQDADADSDAKELVVDLIDFYLSVGDKPEERAAAAAMCLKAIDEVEKKRGSRASKTGKGCFGVVLLVLFVLAGVIWYLL